jgi:hypothetical protein
MFSYGFQEFVISYVNVKFNLNLYNLQTTYQIKSSTQII